MLDLDVCRFLTAFGWRARKSSVSLLLAHFYRHMVEKCSKWIMAQAEQMIWHKPAWTRIRRGDVAAAQPASIFTFRCLFWGSSYIIVLYLDLDMWDRTKKEKKIHYCADLRLFVFRDPWHLWITEPPEPLSKQLLYETSHLTLHTHTHTHTDCEALYYLQSPFQHYYKRLEHRGSCCRPKKQRGRWIQRVLSKKNRKRGEWR